MTTAISLTAPPTVEAPTEQEYDDITDEEISDISGEEETQQEPSDSAQETSGEQPSEDVVAKVLQQNGLSYSAFSDEIANYGKLSDESYTKLAKSGFSKEMVDTYVAGLKSTAELGQKQVQEVMDVVGGKEKFNDLIYWASKNLTGPEQDAYNTMVSGGNPNTAKAAVEWLQSKQRSIEGYTPTLVTGTQKKSASEKLFTSSEQVIRAMSDPRYKSDSDYRKAVERRLSRSTLK